MPTKSSPTGSQSTKDISRSIHIEKDNSVRGLELPQNMSDKKVIMQGYIKVRRKLLFYKKRFMALLDDGTLVL